jgi:hypothetical protein
VEGGGDGDDGGRTDGRGREGEDGWGGGAVSRMVSGNSGGPVAREPATGGGDAAAAAWMREKKRRGDDWGRTEEKKKRWHAWGAGASRAVNVRSQGD